MSDHQASSDAERYERLLAFARDLHSEGATDNEILAALRREWPSPIQSIKVLRAIFAMSLTEAKQHLHASPVWADQVEGWEDLHQTLEAAWTQLGR